MFDLRIGKNCYMEVKRNEGENEIEQLEIIPVQIC